MDGLFSQPQQARREQWLQSSKREDERDGMTEIKGYNDNHLNQKKLLKRLTSERQFAFSLEGENSKRYPIPHTCCWDIKVFLTQLIVNLSSALSHSLIKTEHLQVRCRKEVEAARPSWLSCSCWYRQLLLTVFSNSAHSQRLKREDTGRGGLKVRSVQTAKPAKDLHYYLHSLNCIVVFRSHFRALQLFICT